MAIPAGTCLGPYEVVSLIGAGEVYSARDTRLNRSVTLKVFPEVFTRDTQRIARFEREAQLLASLNQAKVCLDINRPSRGRTWPRRSGHPSIR